jgi:uncharacterized protein (TIGR03437 family)
MRTLLVLVASLASGADFTTALGDAYPYTISAMATDALGNTYVVGTRQLDGGGVTIPGISLTPPTAPVAPTDVFVAKLDPNGKLLFTSRFGGNGSSYGSAIALDPSGNIYIGGNTSASDFPLSKALQTQIGAYGTGFVMKLSGDGSAILYSTYFGGTQGPTTVAALATDAKGNLYLTGSTNAKDFPTTPGMPTGTVSFQGIGVTSGAFVTQISAAGDRIVYSGLIVGGGAPCDSGSSCDFADKTTEGAGIVVDASGNAYIAGNTGTGLPVTAGEPSVGLGGFVAKIAPAGSLAYLAYIDTGQTQLGSLFFFVPYTTVTGIAVDAAGAVYLCGSSNDSNFPTTPGTVQPVFASGPNPVTGNVPSETFVTKLNPTTGAPVWSTFLGGVGSDSAQAIAVDLSGNVWLTGTAQTAAFPNANGWSTGPEYVVELNAAATKVLYSARYPSGTVAQSIAVDSFGSIRVAGLNGLVSAINPNAAPATKIFAFQNAFGGNLTGRIAPWEVISIYGPGIGPATPATAAPVNGVYPTTLGGVQVSVNGANAPLLYVSANQINAVVPGELSSGAGAVMHVTNVPDYPGWIDAAEPFVYPVVLNHDGTVNSQANPARVGSYVTFYATGVQPDFYPFTDGQVASVAKDFCLGSCTVTGDAYATATLLYGGAAPGIVAGVSQWNVQIVSLGVAATYQFSFTVTVPLGVSSFAGTATLAESVWIAP